MIIDQILKFTSLLTAFLVACGVLRFYIYYKMFNISILRFIDISEILILFMDNLLGYFAIIVPSALNIFFLVKFSGHFAKYKPISFVELIRDQLPVSGSFFVGTCTGAIIYFLLSKNLKLKDLFLLIVLIILFIILFPAVFYYTNAFLIDYLKTQMDLSTLLLLFICFFLICYTVIISYLEVDKVKHMGFYKSVKIKFKSEPIINGTPEKFYIGMTKNFIFIYEKSIATTTVYKMNDLESIVF